MVRSRRPVRAPSSRRRLDPVAGGLTLVFVALVVLCGIHLAHALITDEAWWMSTIFAAAGVAFAVAAVAHVNDAYPRIVVDEVGIRREGVLTGRRTSWTGRQWTLTWPRIRTARVVRAYRRPYLLVVPSTPGPTSMSSRLLFAFEPPAGSVAAPLDDAWAAELPDLSGGRITAYAEP